MAGANKEEFAPLLPVGFHSLDQAGRRRLCLDRFPESVTRPRIMNNVEGIIDQINRQAIEGEIWVDGSFMTEKLNPDDADIAFVVPAKVYRTLTFAQRAYFDSFRSTSLYDRYKIDNYGIAIDRNDPEGEWMYVYWAKQFGFSRSNEMKGILKIQVPFLVGP